MFHKVRYCGSWFDYGQRQPPEVFCKKKACNFIKKRLQHRCFPVKFKKFSKTFILKKICERLLLYGLKKEADRKYSEVASSEFLKIFSKN